VVHLIPSSFFVAVVSTLAVFSVSQPAPTRPKIVALGDSLTSGRGVGEELAWPALVQKRLDADKLEYTVVNAGVSGDTSSGAVRRYEPTLDGDVRVLIIALGANDGLRGVPVDRVEQNLGRIIETAQGRGIAVLLCAMEALPIHGWDYTVAFHKVYIELASRYQVPLVPFFLLNVIGNPELMQPDRAHPNAAGHRAIAEKIWPHLEALIARRPSPAGQV
jgi:acyl-CoA thioesterase I